MNICPISYEPCNKKYSIHALRQLSPHITTLKDLPYTASEQLRQAALRADKLSIQGVQPKLSAQFSPKRQSFVLVDKQGSYILKPPNPTFRELPQNEDLTMHLAAGVDIKVPFHGLVYAKDGTLTYFIKRFDRKGKSTKFAVEDFAQLIGKTRETKYNASMEQVAGVVENFCTFPMIEHVKLFKITLFNFLVGNEEMHLKNFSLITLNDKIELSPSYDLVNTTIAVGEATEEIALPLGGKKRKLTPKDFFDYLGKDRLKLPEKIISKTKEQISKAMPLWEKTIRISFLSKDLKQDYLRLLQSRANILSV